jgi:multiple sugar transport system permease protein
MRQKFFTPWLFLTPSFLGFLAFTFLPILMSLGLAFCAWDLFRPPRWVGLDNFYQLLGFAFRESPAFNVPLACFLAVAFLVLAGIAVWKARGLWRLAAPLLMIGAAVAITLQIAEPVNGRFWYFVGNTFYLLLGLPVSMACSLGLAVLLNQALPLRNLFRLAFFLPSIVGGVGIYLLWKWIFNTDYGLINQLITIFHPPGGPAWLESSAWAKNALIIMNIWATAGGANMILYLAALQNVDASLYEAARIDGAGKWHQFLAITWPMVSPTTAFILTMGLIGGFQGGFDAAYVMTRGGPAGATTTLSYFIFENGFRHFYMGRAAAASWILFLMVFCLTLVNWRWMAKRVTY